MELRFEQRAPLASEEFASRAPYGLLWAHPDDVGRTAARHRGSEEEWLVAGTPAPRLGSDPAGGGGGRGQGAPRSGTGARALLRGVSLGTAPAGGAAAAW